MKILSNFDTKLKSDSLIKYKTKYDNNNVLLLSKSGYFLLLKFFLPFTFYVFILLLTIILSYYFFGKDNINYVLYTFLLVLIILLTFAGPSLKHLIDYHMDFAIIVPDALVMYNQTGIFKRDVSTLDTNKIKTITVRKSGFFGSLFNNGDIIFLLEGDNNNFGEVRLFFIHDPEKKKEQVSKIINFKF